MSKYNGWRNRETWLINVHYNPETVEDVDLAQEDFESCLDALQESDMKVLTDFIYDCSIDWQELKDSIEKDESDIKNA